MPKSTRRPVGSLRRLVRGGELPCAAVARSDPHDPSNCPGDDPIEDPADEQLEEATAADAAKVASIFEWLADNEFPGYSPLYEHLARRIASEPWIGALVTRNNRSPFAPILFLGCVHALTLADPELELARRYEQIAQGADPLNPDPWPAFRRLVVERRDELAELLRTRSIQTNEVGRSAALLPAFVLVAARVRPAARPGRGGRQRGPQPLLRPVPRRLPARGPRGTAGPCGRGRATRLTGAPRLRGAGPAVAPGPVGAARGGVAAPASTSTRWM